MHRVVSLKFSSNNVIAVLVYCSIYLTGWVWVGWLVSKPRRETQTYLPTRHKPSKTQKSCSIITAHELRKVVWAQLLLLYAGLLITVSTVVENKLNNSEALSHQITISTKTYKEVREGKRPSKTYSWEWQFWRFEGFRDFLSNLDNDPKWKEM